jgi:hypothetical protein
MSNIIEEGLRIADQLNGNPKLAAEVANYLEESAFASMLPRLEFPELLIDKIDLEECREDILKHVEGLDRPEARLWLHGFEGQTIVEELEDNEEWQEWIFEWVLAKGRFQGVLNALTEVTKEKENAVAKALAEYFEQDPKFKTKCLLGDLY